MKNLLKNALCLLCLCVSLSNIQAQDTDNYDLFFIRSLSEELKTSYITVPPYKIECIEQNKNAYIQIVSGKKFLRLKEQATCMITIDSRSTLSPATTIKIVSLLRDKYPEFTIGYLKSQKCETKKEEIAFTFPETGKKIQIP